MLAFGCAVGSRERLETIALPPIERLRENDTTFEAIEGAPSIFVAYNQIMDRARANTNLEALVLLHEDVEIMDPDFAAKVRSATAERDVAVVGAIGARGVGSAAWWEGLHHIGRVLSPGFTPGGVSDTGGGRAGDVDAVDGLMLVLSPWAVRELRFDESLAGFHGYDVDICLQARERGRRVIVREIEVAHRAVPGFREPESWQETELALVRKWEHRLDSFSLARTRLAQRYSP